jgi:hypothetical protein
MMDKEEIIAKSKLIFGDFTDVCLDIPDEEFFLQPADKWSIAQNVDHLIRSVKYTRLAYCLPKSIVRRIGGKPNRPSRTYDELVEKYKLKLAQGGKASGRYIPKTVVLGKFKLMQKWQRACSRYLESIDLNWKDDQLDNYIVSHPLLGKITLRELCYFTIYHPEHHLNIIKSRIALHPH